MKVSPKWLPKSIPNQWKIEVASGRRPGTAFGGPKPQSQQPLLDHFCKKVRFRVPFWGHWILKGVPKSHFFNINQHKMRKSEVPESVSKKHDFWMDFLCQNGRPWGVKTSISLDTCCKIRCFGVSQKGIEKESQKSSKMTSKSSFGVPPGPFLEVFVGFARGQIFDDFLIGQ